MFRGDHIPRHCRQDTCRLARRSALEIQSTADPRPRQVKHAQSIHVLGSTE